MADSFDILDLNAIVDDIFFSMNNQSQSCIVIKGESGSGKTYIGREVEKRWNFLNGENATFYTQGDSYYSERPYHPFSESLFQIEKKPDVKSLVQKGAGELSKGIPVAGDFVSFLIDIWSNNRKTKKKESLKYLTPYEQQIVEELESIYHDKNVLFILDNFHWWDEPSLGFLRILFEHEFDGQFSFLLNAKFIFILTDDQHSAHYKSIKGLLDSFLPLIITISHIREKDFLTTLRKFGFTGILDEKTAHLLYSFTGGHLTLLKNLISYLSEPAIYNSYIDNNFLDHSPDHQRFLEEILTLRLKNWGMKGNHIIEVLEYASVIGLSFSFEELVCVSKEEEANLSEIINSAKENHLLEDSAAKTSFAHDIIREFFLNRLQGRKANYLNNFAQCLRVLRPGDYLTRAKFSLESGNVEESIILSIIGYLKDKREGQHTSKTVTAFIETMCVQFGMQEYYSAISDAYDNYLSNEYNKAVIALEAIEDFVDQRLIAEKYYLLAICKSKTKELYDLTSSVNYLTDWSDLKQQESEQWVRIMSTLMIMYLHIYEYPDARKIEKQIMIYLSGRVKFDSSASVNLNIIRRKSSALHPTEIAAERTLKSLEFFSNATEQNKLLHPVEYFKSLSNHSGNLIVLMELEKALDYSSFALALIKAYPNILFPNPYISGNNYILSAFLSNKISAGEALQGINEILTDCKNPSDRMLVESNAALLNVFNNDLITANAIFDKLLDILGTKDEMDAYYDYFIRNNAICVKFLLGDDTGSERWKTIEQIIPNIPEKPFLARRHKLMAPAFTEVNAGEWQVWNDYLKGKYTTEIGPAWKFFGHGFLFTDLQYWSES